MCMWIFILFLIPAQDAFGASSDADNTISVMEGDSVSLHISVSAIERDEQILWRFGPENSRIAEIYKQKTPTYDSNELFKDRLEMNNQTGSLTIKNIRIKHSGLYRVTLISNRGISDKRFRVTVYAHLPIPNITRDNSSSEFRCSLVCSVLNVSDVTLSWYKGMSVLSNISVSDLSISLSLPLDVEYQDKNTYSCVINNPVRNQTTHLDITQLCQQYADSEQCCGFTEAVIRLVISAVVGVATVALLVDHFRSNSIGHKQEVERSPSVP
ncbi:SLAM family member 6-like [Pimephales promelas]|nr:SLAM family member 6-like [Pimephales promelas]